MDPLDAAVKSKNNVGLKPEKPVDASSEGQYNMFILIATHAGVSGSQHFF
jgi:hypothetical protein